MILQDALQQLNAAIEPGRADGMAAYHKQSRVVLGVANPVLNELSRNWRAQTALPERVALARDLWDSDIFEARIAAAKMLTQARIADDGPVWDLILGWVPQFDSWAIADHACSAGARRLRADPARLNIVAGWTTSDHLWTKRAALVMTLPWAKLTNPKPEDHATRDRILAWAGDYVQDQQWFIQKAVAWWVRDLSKHDTARAQAFLDTYGDQMKAFARKEAGKYLQG